MGAYLAAFVASRLMLALAGSELVPWSAEAAVLREQMARAEPWTAALVFLLSLVLAAVAGVLYAFFTEFVGTEDFLSEVTFVVLLMVILGGAGNHRGAVLGTLVMTAIDRFTRPSFLALLGINLAVDINYARHTLIGLLLVLLILYRPRGLFPEGRVQTPAREEVHHLHGAS